jgi:predicted pyridoxine 5'-phosphate oxidase superfamily flavin-nucleotide-binding protein
MLTMARSFVGQEERRVAVAILTEDMKRIVREQRLGFYATVCEDGSPNLSPKGTTRVWDDDHLFFADLRSPRTVANISRGSLVEINVVDPFMRKGYRFKGPAVIHEPGSSGFVEALGLASLGSTSDFGTRSASRASADDPGEDKVARSYEVAASSSCSSL